MYHQLSSIIIMYHQVSLCHLVHEADHGSSGAIWTGDSDASTAGQQRDTVHGLRASGASGSAHRGPHRRSIGVGAPWQDSTPPCWHRPCNKLKLSSKLVNKYVSCLFSHVSRQNYLDFYSSKTSDESKCGQSVVRFS